MINTQGIDNLTMTLNTGESIRFRQIRKDDDARMQALFNTFSPETVFHRLQEPIDKLTPDRTRRFVDNDPTEVCALAAYYLDKKGLEVFVGVARFGRAGTDRAEFAVVVGDRWQRKGIGRLLMTALATVALDNKIEWFDCTFDICNKGFMDFAVATGLKGELNYEDGQLLMQTAVKTFLSVSERDPQNK